MKTFLTVLILLLDSLQTMAQCRLIRVESPDTAIISYYNYDKLGRLTSVKSDLLFQGKPMKFEFHYSYNIYRL